MIAGTIFELKQNEWEEIKVRSNTEFSGKDLDRISAQKKNRGKLESSIN